eukprot:jgi/Psemu1/299924/fgenesh1_kg.3_\
MSTQGQTIYLFAMFCRFKLVEVVALSHFRIDYFRVHTYERSSPMVTVDNSKHLGLHDGNRPYGLCLVRVLSRLVSTTRQTSSK